MRVYGSGLHDMATCKYGCCGADLAMKGHRPRVAAKATVSSKKRARQNARKDILSSLFEND